MRQGALEGLPFEDVYIFDVHGHLNTNSEMLYLDTDAAGVVRTMDRLGVNAICVSSLLATTADCKLGNDLVQKAAKQFPGRIYGYVAATPYYEKFGFEDYFTPGSGMLGFKIHAAHNGTCIRDERYLPYMEFADKNRLLPVLFHAWEKQDVEDVAYLAETFRNCPLILGHSGVRSYPVRMAAIEAVRKYENIFVDTAISITYDGSLEWLVSRIGADRILYGSDLPFFDCRQVLGNIALSNLTMEEKEKILGGNAGKIIRGGVGR